MPSNTETRQRIFIKVGDVTYDAHAQWGVVFDSTSLSTLLAPAPLKEMIENKSALEDGKRVFRTGRKWDERTLTLGFNLIANSRQDFYNKYNAFCSQVLAGGKIDLYSSYNPDVWYHLDYLSCQSFGEFAGGTLGKFILRVVESNPGNRTE